MSSLLISSLLVGCLEEEDSNKIENLVEKLDGQRFDIGRAKEFIATEKLKLEEFQQAGKDLKESVTLKKSIEAAALGIEQGAARNLEFKDELELAKLELDQHRKVYRAQARKAAIGKNIDLSATKGAKFKEVRVMTINPLAIKVYMPTGPETIPLRDIPEDVREMLQMSDEEAAAYIERKGESAVARAEKFKKWKEGQAGRDKEASKNEILQRIKDLQEEIYKREDAINVRLQEMKNWKTKASNMELEAAEEKSQARSRRIERHAELARDKALVLSDMNSDSWIVVGRLKAELEDLKRMGVR